MTDRKLHMIGTEINDLEWPLCTLLEPTVQICMKLDLYYQWQIRSPGTLVTASINFYVDIHREFCGKGLIKRLWAI